MIKINYKIIIILAVMLLYNSCEDRFKANIPSYIEIKHFDYDNNTTINPPHHKLSIY